MTQIEFMGKAAVYNHHLSVPFRPLLPDASKSVGDVDMDGNLIIEGDNLHALKSLLPFYAGQVDCIYIDPPYNTGNEGWSYNDNVNAPQIKEWLDANPIAVDDQLRHDKWCAMMWPRLRLLHQFLSNRGVIFVSIDDNEAYRLKAMMDEKTRGKLTNHILHVFRSTLICHRDRMAEILFRDLVDSKIIQFHLRADSHQYIMPDNMDAVFAAQSRIFARDDGHPPTKSLFSPIFEVELNGDEKKMACYLDKHDAIGWWHRNVARKQYGIQGWQRHKIYPDFIFAGNVDENDKRLFVLESKGDDRDNSDSTYKKSVLKFLSDNFENSGASSTGTMDLVSDDGTIVSCDLVFYKDMQSGVGKLLEKDT